MAQERWRLDDTSYAAGTAITRDGTSAGNNNYLLVPVLGGNAPSSTTSSWEGSRALLTTATTSPIFFRYSSNTIHVTPGAYFIDFLVFIPTAVTGAITLGLCSNDPAVEYSWAKLVASGGNYTIALESYDPVNGTVTRAAAVTAGAINAWCRVRIKTTQFGVNKAELWTGSELPTDAVGGNEGATPTAATTTWNGGSFSNWVSLALNGDAPPADIRIDDVLFNVDTAPTRLPQNVQAALSETATLTSTATRTLPVSGALSATNTLTALAGKVVTAQADLTTTATASSDAAVITTHNAEAYLAATAATAIGTGLTRGMVADLVTAATLNGTAATNTAAQLVAAAAMTAKVRIEGETTPGTLRSRVITNTITS